MKLSATFLLLLLVVVTRLQAQSVSINNDGSAPDPKAMLDIKSTTKGFLLPRMTEQQRLALVNLAPSGVPLGLLVFQTDGDRGFYYNSSSFPGIAFWRKLINPNDMYWSKSGTDIYNADLSSKVGVGTSTPSANLDVNGTFRLRNNGAATGKVLTSDVDGNATWQLPSSLVLPYSGSASSNSADIFRVKNTGTGFSAGYFENSNTGNQNAALQGISTTINGFGTGIYGQAVAGVSKVTYGVNGYVTGTYTAGYGVHGQATNATGVGGESNAGFGVEGLARGTNGWGGYFAGFTGAKALRTYGGLRFTGVDEADGKVLTSDGEGNATWKNPGLPSLSATFSADQVIPVNTYTAVKFRTDQYDGFTNFLASAFDNSTGSFTAPTTGIYEFSAQVRFSSSFGLANEQDFNIYLTKTNTSPWMYLATEFHFDKSIDGGNTLLNPIHYLTKVARLNAGDVVQVLVKHNVSSGTVEVINPTGFYSNFSVVQVK